MASRADDLRWLRRCLVLARRAEGRTAPNPIVGCVIVSKAGKLLAEGWHERAGLAHAEAVALAKVGGKARGATVYVNLEPCNHTTGRRTAPCAPALEAAGIGRLVFGVHDPFPGHGGGAARLRAAGVQVVGPLLEVECRRANAPFWTWATRRRAHVTLKAAMSLDGKIATRTGESQWISCELARQETHRLRDRLDAILVGAGTVAADDPMLTTRGVRGGRDPVRVVLDGKLSISPRAKIFEASAAPTLVMTAQGAPARKARALEAAGAQVIELPARAGVVDLHALAAELGKRGLLSVLVEGGGQTHAAFLAAGVVDRLILHVAPLAIGGPAPSWLGGEGVTRLRDAPRFELVSSARRGADVELVYERA
jgi:diaminohydroxyphosphoribosylaminopyrimidine deaminase/5-amino-6-(5-phosphoribosylamino)uracil reductase